MTAFFPFAFCFFSLFFVFSLNATSEEKGGDYRAVASSQNTICFVWDDCFFLFSNVFVKEFL